MAPTPQAYQGIQIDVVPLSERAVAAERWLCLEQRIGSTTLKNSWAWINTWLDYFGPDTCYGNGIPCAFVFGLVQNQDIGAALLPISSLDLGLFSVPTMALGTAGEPLRERTYIQYNQFLVELDFMENFAQGLVNYLLKQKWSILWIESFLSSQAEALICAGKNLGVPLAITKEPSPTFDFRKLPVGTEIWQGISHDQRSKLRRSMKHLTSQLGPQSIEWAITCEQALDILEELIVLHTDQWRRKGDPGAFRTQRLRDYHRQLVRIFFPHHLIAFRVKQGDTTIGCLLNLIENDCGHITNHRSGFLTFTDNRLKPGYITNVLFMQEAMKRGYTEFDFLDGHIEYKKHLANTQHILISIEAYRGLRSRAFRTTRELYRRSRTSRVVEQIKRSLVK